MAFINLSERQKRIINPYPISFDGDARRGVGYPYNDNEKKFIIDAIHESHLYFFKFPRVGTRLLGQENVEITVTDLRAYFALYPQNGKMGQDGPQEISVTDSIQQLKDLSDSLRQKGVYANYSSASAKESYLKEYELEQDLAKLIAIPENHSHIYKNKLRKALSLPETQFSSDTGLDLLDLPPDISSYVGSDTNVDLYDWRKNCEPGDEPIRAYYNAADKSYYFTARTNVISNRLIGTLSAMKEMKRKLELQTDEDRYIRLFEEERYSCSRYSGRED